MRRSFPAIVLLFLIAAVPAVSLAEGTHVVRKGETLGKIARAHHVSVARLRAANGLHGSRVSAGTKLVIPGPKAHPKRRRSRARSHAAANPPEANLPTEAEVAEAATPADNVTAAAGAVADAPGPEESIKDRLLRVAQRMLSVPYRFGGTTLWGLDCSGFVQKAFSFLSRDLPRSAREQFREGVAVEKSDLSPGDLVFFRTYAKYPSHVGIYLGDNRFVHASSRDRKVTVDSLDAPYYVKRYIGAKRLLFEENEVQN
ncbi:MAG: hypothetical protein OHK0028_17010 [Deltaproteobacteria bacterium]